ncbi:MAG: hypothetical protein GXY36_17150 [Chloroflexi bacterium]|nr:hypothetical protein [Chloroflexota bacterium]
MRIRFLILLLVLALSAAPVLAQADPVHVVSFDGFRFSFDESLATNVDIWQFPGDPVDWEAPGWPQSPHTRFTLYNEGDETRGGLLQVPGVISVYPVADFESYPANQDQYQQLQTLLAERPDLEATMAVNDDGTGESLPFLPIVTGVQVIRARAGYVQTETLSGIAYVTLFRLDVSPFVASEFLYTFQGLSSDGSIYVSAVFNIDAGMFPAEMGVMDETFDEQFIPYLRDSVSQLNQAEPFDFEPTLDRLEAVIGSFGFEG